MPEGYKPPKPHCMFLSHNRADKGFVTRLASVLTVLGIQVWLDDWAIKPGDSIPTAIDQGLKEFDTFVLAWSEDAAGSKWVGSERDAAISRVMSSPNLRIVPVILDDTPLPPLLAPLKYVDARNYDHVQAARGLADVKNDREYRLAIQEFLDNAGLEPRGFYGAGVFVACPNCGASTDRLEQWGDTNSRGDECAGVRCKECGWIDGGEI